MPLQIIEMTDPLTQMIHFQTSVIYEMLNSTQTLVFPSRHTDWVQSAQTALGATFMQKLQDLYIPYSYGASFFELAVDYPDQEDVLGFIAYLRAMPLEEFTFYLLGRMIPVEAIHRTGLNPQRLYSLMRSHPEADDFMCSLGLSLEQVSDLATLRQRVADLWETYWVNYFQDEVNDLRPHWLNAIEEKQRWLAQEGGEMLIQRVTNKTHLPDPIPPDQPFQKVIFIPAYYIARQAFTFYGYGSVVVIFDAQRTEKRIQEQERAVRDMLETLKALEDESRLRILQLLSNPSKNYNGKRIAEKLNMTPSTVSRHISQLKAGNLVEEVPFDSRNSYYRIKRETINQLPHILLDYIYT